MKINQDYPVLPSGHNTMDNRQGYLLYMDDGRALDPDEMKLLGDRDVVWLLKITSFRIHATCNAMPICFAASSISMPSRDFPLRR